MMQGETVYAWYEWDTEAAVILKDATKGGK